MQMASLFTSMQQVEIRRRKEGETIEEYNRNKSLANLTKARFMKQMEKITKELKKDTLLTHNYPIPMPTERARNPVLDDVMGIAVLRSMT